MPRISKIRLSRIDTRLSQRRGEPEDFAAFVERMACSDHECFELLCAFARTGADYPQDEQVQFEAFSRFIDRVEDVLARDPSLTQPCR